jgi:hypothetical protein
MAARGRVMSGVRSERRKGVGVPAPGQERSEGERGTGEGSAARGGVMVIEMVVGMVVGTREGATRDGMTGGASDAAAAESEEGIERATAGG